MAPRPAFSATNEPASAPVPDPLAVLLQRIAKTDRIISSNWCCPGERQPGYSFQVGTDDVRRIVQAVSAASYVKGQEHPDFEWPWELQFYAGTNLLSSIRCWGDTFLLNGVYRDASGVVAEISRDSYKREYRSRVYWDEEKDFADSKKAEAKQWLKSSLHAIRGQDRKKVVRFVDDFYAAGAAKVFVADVQKQDIGKTSASENAKFLCVVLPSDRETRRNLFRVHWRAANEFGLDADDDVGQKYTWYPFD